MLSDETNLVFLWKSYSQDFVLYYSKLEIIDAFIYFICLIKFTLVY